MSIINCEPDNSPQGPRGIIRTTDCVGGIKGCAYVFPEEGEVLAPWVAIDFTDFATRKKDGANAAITVSNFSSTTTDPANCAVIKSFSLGGSNGLDVKITIHDTQGGSFTEFMKHICGDWLCLDGNTGSIQMKIQFGWAKNTCGAALKRNASVCHYVNVMKVDANFTEGKLSFDIIGNDTAMASFYGGVENLDGGEGQNTMHLVHALHKLWCDSCAPTIGNLTFNLVVKNQNNSYQYNPNATKEETENAPKIFRADTVAEQQFGPLGKWACNGENKMMVTQRWIAESRSFNDKPWDVKFNVNDENGQLQFWEITKPNKQSEGDAFFDALCIGTFIVNGGSASPVLEFNPKLSWNFALVNAGSGGNIADQKMNAMGTDGAKNPGEEAMPKERYEGAGQVTTTNPSDGQKDRHGDRSMKEAAGNEALDKKGININSYDNITADLVIVGNPNIWPPFESRGKYATIIVVNPFHLIPDGNGNDWLAKPGCNEILSNKAWMVTSVNHQIDAGKYVTTIGLELATPGVNLPATGNFGGWNKGWQPTTCG